MKGENFSKEQQSSNEKSVPYKETLSGAQNVLILVTISILIILLFLGSIKKDVSWDTIITALVIITAVFVVIYFISKKAFKKATIVGIISIIVIAAIIVINKKPWQQWKRTPVQQTQLSASTQTALLVPPPEPGPHLKWGENTLVAGEHYTFYRSVGFTTSLLSKWYPDIKLTCFKEGYEDSIFYEIIFTPDKSTKFGKNHDNRSADGEWFLQPSQTMTVYIRPS